LETEKWGEDLHPVGHVVLEFGVQVLEVQVVEDYH
jgi:hypothetical protein